MSRAMPEKQDISDSTVSRDSSVFSAENVLDRQKQLLHAVNSVAAVLLSVADEKKFAASLNEGMEIMARCVDADRINIWRNETREGNLYYVKQYEWTNEIARQNDPAGDERAFPYDLNSSEWKSKFLAGECVNGPLVSLSQDEQMMLGPYGIKSILVLPVDIEECFWGFVSFDDCRRERVFAEEEVNILRSASLIMASAVDRNANAAQINEAHQRARLMLDATPLACSLWDGNNINFDCNEETVKLFELKDKKDFLGHFFDFSPEYQPGGQPSKEMVFEYAGNAFRDGRCVFEWMHQLRDGTPLPAEVTLVRVKYGGEYIVAAYMRDMRGYKRMIQAIEHKNNLLDSVISNYLGIILSVDQNNIITLFNGLHVDKLGKQSATLEGTLLDAGFHGGQYSEIVSKIRKTFTEGPQDWISEIDHAVLHMRTTPVSDDNGCVVSVVCNIDDITDIVSLQYELEAALKKAQLANHAKSNFLARMSHEMRTPLNAIIGLSELAVAIGGLNEEALANTEKIYNAGMTLLGTINDLLDISKIEEGELELAPGKYHTASIINDAISQSLWHIGEKPVDFVLDVDESLPVCLFGDDVKVKQIFHNLLSNAFKYTKKGRVELSLRCEREDDSVWMIIRVSDTGIGINSEELSRLFIDYTQIGMESNPEFRGTGLGLSLTKRIAELMDGSVVVESEYGKGSVFTVSIRQGFVSAATLDAATVKDLKDFKYSYRSHFRRGRELRPTAVRLPDARVLVVDDISVNLDVAKGMLKPYGMQVDCVMSGQQAIDAIRDEKVRYDAIFMDHMMPGMDGITAVRIIREEIGTEYAGTIPVIALTANVIQGNEKEFLRNGFQDFLRKPIEIARLDAVVRKWLCGGKIEEPLENRQATAYGREAPPTEKDGGYALDRRSGKERRKTSDEKNALLDLVGGIERFGGDRESFAQILRSFGESTRSLLDVVKDVAEDNLVNYAITVHGIKGSSRSICAEVTGNMAEVLEKAAKAGDFEFVRAHNLDFIRNIETLLAHIDDTLATMVLNTPKPKKDKPDIGTLSELLAACKKYDMDGVDAAMAEIESFEYESDEELVTWLRSNVEQMNFTQIEEKLSALIDAVEG